DLVIHSFGRKIDCSHLSDFIFYWLPVLEIRYFIFYAIYDTISVIIEVFFLQCVTFSQHNDFWLDLPCFISQNKGGIDNRIRKSMIEMSKSDYLYGNLVWLQGIFNILPYNLLAFC